jgi:hypothetical protein
VPWSEKVSSHHLFKNTFHDPPTTRMIAHTGGVPVSFLVLSFAARPEKGSFTHALPARLERASAHAKKQQQKSQETKER